MARTSRGLLERVRENEVAEEGEVAGGPISVDGQPPGSPTLKVLESQAPAHLTRTVAGAGQPLPPHLLAIKKPVHLRMRPDRIVVGECRGGEALDMLQAMNTGHDGSMSTVHANSPVEAMGRLETLVLMSGTDLPSRAIREQIASAVHIVVQQQRLRGGQRRIVSVSEVIGFDEASGSVQLQELFTFNQVGVSPEGKAIGYHTATGVLPVRLDRFQKSGEDLPGSLFDPIAQPSQSDLY